MNSFRDDDNRVRLPRRRALPPILPAALLLAVFFAVSVLGVLAPNLRIVAAAGADDGSDDNVWLQNPELRATRAPVDADSAAAGADVDAPVYDSADFQWMLLLQESWDTAFVLDLLTEEVLAYSPAAMEGPDGTLRQPPVEEGFSCGVFTGHEDGRMTFEADGYAYAIEPLPPMIGPLSREDLARRQGVYEQRAAAYEPDPALIARIAGVAEEIEILAFFSAWCYVCKIHLPALLKSLDDAANDRICLRLIALDEEMAQPASLIDEYGIGRTPTFVVQLAGAEIGRIEEEPQVSVEADLVQILFGPDGR